LNRFAFIVHALDHRDFALKYPITRYLPGRLVEWIGQRMSSKVVSHVTGIKSVTGAEIDGYLVGCPLTARVIMNGRPDFVLGKIVEAARAAQDVGAGIVGLGAFTSVFGDAGISIAERVGIAVTTGNSLTVATAIEGVLKACELMHVDPKKASAGVVGAGGSIGRVCCHLLKDTVASLTLIGLESDPLEDLRAELEEAGDCAVDIRRDAKKVLPELDVLVSVTSAVDTVIDADDLKRGAVVCDVARPRDVSKDVAEKRDDVLVIEGGVVAVPGENVDFRFRFGFPDGMAYACMCETMVLALAGRYESFTLGRELSLEKVLEIRDLAKKHGFRLAGFRSFERAITDEQIDEIRKAAGR